MDHTATVAVTVGAMGTAGIIMNPTTTPMTMNTKAAARWGRAKVTPTPCSLSNRKVALSLSPSLFFNIFDFEPIGFENK